MQVVVNTGFTILLSYSVFQFPSMITWVEHNNLAQQNFMTTMHVLGYSFVQS